jgi:hypothetical protein
MSIPESRQKIAGIFSRRRFQALAAAGVLSVGLGVGAVSGVFAAPSHQAVVTDATPTATTTSSDASPTATSTTPGPTNPGGLRRGPGGFGHFGRGPGGPGLFGGQFLGPVATFIGISTTDLQTALKNGQTLTDVAVAHGKTAADLKAFLLSQDGARIDKLISTKFPARPVVGALGFRGGFFGADVAKFLGISESDFRTALKNGQTPAQIAVAHGKTADDLKTYLTSQLKTQLDKQVAAGKLTAQQETDRLNQAGTMIDKFLNMSFPARGAKPGAPAATPTAAATT